MPKSSVETVTRSSRAAPVAAQVLSAIFLLGSLILYPYAEHSGFEYYAFRVLGSAAILFGVYAVSFRRSLIIFALAASNYTES
jgi:hypothetical protein